MLSPSHEFINGAFIDASHDQWREMISIGQGLIIQNLKYERGYVISFKTLYDMISRCTGENESPLTSLLSSIQHFQHDIESHNAVIDFHILSIEKSIEQLKSLKALL